MTARAIEREIEDFCRREGMWVGVPTRFPFGVPAIRVKSKRGGWINVQIADLAEHLAVALAHQRGIAA
jgi:hypothetical protein